MNTTPLDQVVSIIGDVNDMTIATIREDGFPQATTVSYVNDGITVFFLTPTNSQKVANLSRNNKVSVTINRAYDNWNEIEGLSMGALAVRILDSAEIEKVGNMILSKFPEAKNFAKDDVGDLALFRLDPIVISLLDYKKGFGYATLIEL